MRGELLRTVKKSAAKSVSRGHVAYFIYRTQLVSRKELRVRWRRDESGREVGDIPSVTMRRRMRSIKPSSGCRGSRR